MGVRIARLGEIDYEWTEKRQQICLRIDLDAPLTLPRKKVRLAHHQDWGFGYWAGGRYEQGVPPWLPCWVHYLIEELPYTDHEYFSCTLTCEAIRFKIWLDEPIRHLERFLEALARKMERWADGGFCSKWDLERLAAATGSDRIISARPCALNVPLERWLTVTPNEAFGVEDAELFAPSSKE